MPRAAVFRRETRTFYRRRIPGIAVPTSPIIRSSAVAGNTTTTSTSTTVTKPAGLALDDYLLAFQFGDADNLLASMTGPSGFATLSSQAPNAGTNIPCAKVWGIQATATEVAASNFVFNDASGGDSVTILVAIVAGTYDTSDPIDFSTWTAQARVSSMVQTAPSATGVDRGLLLSIFGTDANGSSEQYPASGPAGTTLVNQFEAVSLFSMGGVYSERLAASGATGTRVVSPTPGGITTNGWIATTAVVNPPPVVIAQQGSVSLTVSPTISLNGTVAGTQIAVRSRNQNAQTTDSTSHPISLPAGVVAGDLLYVPFSIDTATAVTSTTSTGWAKLIEQAQGTTTNQTGSVWWKQATGSDALTINSDTA